MINTKAVQPALDTDSQAQPMDVQLEEAAAAADIQAWVKDLQNIAAGVKAESSALAEEWDMSLREKARLLQMLEEGGRPCLRFCLDEPLCGECSEYA